jgi:hypothetical protein
MSFAEQVSAAVGRTEGRNRELVKAWVLKQLQSGQMEQIGTDLSRKFVDVEDSPTFAQQVIRTGAQINFVDASPAMSETEFVRLVNLLDPRIVIRVVWVQGSFMDTNSDTYKRYALYYGEPKVISRLRDPV